MIKIISNGSKWAGEQPDSIETLLERLASHALDPRFEEFGNFILPARRARHLGNDQYQDLGPVYPEAPDAVRFWGNFLELSAVFEVDTDEPELIDRLTSAIRANQATPAYVAAKRAQEAADKQARARRKARGLYAGAQS
jgi:hypothetical protein